MKKETILLATVFLFTGAYIPLAFGAESAKIISQANELYKKGEYRQARQLYEEALAKQPDKPLLNFNAGAAQFKTGAYDKAAASFEKGLVSQDKILESYSGYNLANTKYKIAKAREGADSASAMRLMEEALGHYKRAIELDPKDTDAKFNYELVNGELKKLKQMPKQQQQGQGQNKQQQNQPEKQQGGQQQEQQPQSRGQEEQEQQKQEGRQESQQPQQQGSREQNKQSKQQEQQGSIRAGEPKEMSPEEAKMLLEGYWQEESQQGKLEDTRKGTPSEAIKDW